MIINYTFDKCANKINTARILRSGQEQFCQIIESYIRSVNDYKAENPEDETDFMINSLTDILARIRVNITEVDKIFSKIELLKQTRLLNLWFKELQIEEIQFPEIQFGTPTAITGEYIEARKIFERD